MNAPGPLSSVRSYIGALTNLGSFRRHSGQFEAEALRQLQLLSARIEELERRTVAWDAYGRGDDELARHEALMNQLESVPHGLRELHRRIDALAKSSVDITG